jgi:hypothetical protein
MMSLISGAVQRLLSATTMLTVVGGLLGIAWAGDAASPGSFGVATPMGVLPVGDLTLPIALVMVGRVFGKAVDKLVSWKPHFVVEHIYETRRDSKRDAAEDDP